MSQLYLKIQDSHPPQADIIYSSLMNFCIYPNRICHFQTQVQDNPYATDPMSIIIPDGKIIAFLDSEGTNIFLNTLYPTQEDLALLPHIELTSQKPWEPHKIAFPATKNYVKEEKESRRGLPKFASYDFVTFKHRYKTTHTRQIQRVSSAHTEASLLV